MTVQGLSRPAHIIILGSKYSETLFSLLTSPPPMLLQSPADGGTCGPVLIPAPIVNHAPRGSFFILKIKMQVLLEFDDITLSAFRKREQQVASFFLKKRYFAAQA